MQKLYGNTKLDYAAKIGFLRTGVKEVEPLRASVVIWVATDYETFHKTIKDYKTMQKTVFASDLSIEGSLTQDAIDQHHSCPDAISHSRNRT